MREHGASFILKLSALNSFEVKNLFAEIDYEGNSFFFTRGFEICKAVICTALDCKRL